VITAIGLEMDQDGDRAAIAIAGREEGDPRYLIDLMFYGDADLAAAEVNRLYMTLESSGAYLDPMPCAGLLAPLRAAGTWLHLLEAVDVAAASYEFKAEVRARRVRTTGHEALRESMKYALRRPLAAAFAFERRRVAVDMAPLNAAAFALWGLLQNEGGADPGVWML
jgi:hypothetical protein